MTEAARLGSVFAHLARAHATLGRGVHAVPAALEERVARVKLAALGVATESLTSAQRAYMSAWQTGT